MCFSASASFTSGVVLTFIGIACLKKTQHPSTQLFASIPILFGIQQIAEGILWITIPNLEYRSIQKVFTYLFLFFAQILWPFWVPLSILIHEKNDKKKKILKFFLAAGIMVSVYLSCCLLSFNVEAKIEGRHIKYIQDYPSIFRGYGTILYAVATVAPAFFSSIRRIWIFGVAIVISYIVSAIFYEHYVLSVWCFFSAIISLSIYLIVRDMRASENIKVYIGAS